MSGFHADKRRFQLHDSSFTNKTVSQTALETSSKSNDGIIPMRFKQENKRFKRLELDLNIGVHNKHVAGEK